MKLVSPLPSVVLAMLLMLPFSTAWGQCGTACDSAKTDVNCNGGAEPFDVVALLNLVHLNILPACSLTACKGDLNCDGFRDDADIELLGKCVFLGSHTLGPCPIPDIRPTVPDPRDSIILESKVIAPGSGNPYMKLRVWITNKDRLASVVLPLRETSDSGNVYAVLATPRTFAGVVTRLTSTLAWLNPQWGFNASGYDNSSPDSFFIAPHRSPVDPGSQEPPNSTRKALWDIKFNMVTATGTCAGRVIFDTTRIFDETVQFVDEFGRRVPVNFVKGVVSLPARGDLDAVGGFTSSDVMLMLNCVFLGIGSCHFCLADLNCDTNLSPADAVLELILVFLGTPVACTP